MGHIESVGIKWSNVLNGFIEVYSTNTLHLKSCSSIHSCTDWDCAYDSVCEVVPNYRKLIYEDIGEMSTYTLARGCSRIGIDSPYLYGVEFLGKSLYSSRLIILKRRFRNPEDLNDVINMRGRRVDDVRQC